MILISILLLSGLGGAIIGSVAPTLLTSQLAFYVVGLMLYFVFSRIDYRIYSSTTKLIFILSLLLLGLTLLIGLETRGSVRWINIAGFRLQFSEILKPFLVTVFASMFMDRKNLKTAILAVIPIFLVFKQPDLGSALVYVLSFVSIAFASGLSLWYFAGAGVLGALFLPIGWLFLADYQKSRIISFLNPNLDPQGANYNAIQAVIAVGSGMLFGRGLGRGPQSHLLFLPEHHTDFVFAAVSEEFGFIGAFFLLTIYFFLFWKIFSLAGTVKDRFASLILVGLGAILLSQVVINIGMNLGVIPVTGITLPLISYGGSSVLSTMIMLGIVANIAKTKSPTYN